MEDVFSKLKNDILGKQYDLSIAYVSVATSRELNKKYRKKNKPTNVLSFPLSKNSGELILCKEVIKREAKENKFDKNFRELLGTLVIHGMLHLKGLLHSSRMEQEEKKYDKKYFYRNRLGNRNDKSRRSAIRKRRKKS